MVLELKDGLAVPGDVDLVVGVLEDVDLVVVSEHRWWLAHAQTLLGDVAVAEVAARKLSRGHGEGVASRQLVHARARLDHVHVDLVLVRLVRPAVSYLVVEYVEAHRCQGHARHYVTRAEPNRHVARFRYSIRVWVGARHYVTESNRAQAHEAKVTCV